MARAVIVVLLLSLAQCSGNKQQHQQSEKSTAAVKPLTQPELKEYAVTATPQLMKDAGSAETPYAATATLVFEVEPAKKTNCDEPPMEAARATEKAGAIVCVFFNVREAPVYLSNRRPATDWSVSVTKSAQGAFVEYSERKQVDNSYYNNRSAELNLEEWQDFINELYACRVDRWVHGYYQSWPCTTHVGDVSWELDIFFSDKGRLKYDGSSDMPSADKFMKIMNDLKIRTSVKNAKRPSAIMKNAAPIENSIARGANGLEVEYEKRFGKPISRFERSIVCISFGAYPYGARPYREFSVVMGAGGAFAEYIDYRFAAGIKPEDHTYNSNSAKLSLGEYLDFINALHACNIGEWEERYPKPPKNGAYTLAEGHPINGTPWTLRVFFSDKETLRSFGTLRSSTNPPGFERFVSIMDGIKLKIEKEQ
jgi:hypothetical protein